MDVSKQVQDKLAQFQNIQNQIQMVSMQKQQLMLQSADLDNAKNEIEPAANGKIYRLVGPILIETTKEASLKYVTDEHDSAETKIKVLEKQEKKLLDKMNEMRSELTSMLQPPGGN